MEQFHHLVEERDRLESIARAFGSDYDFDAVFQLRLGELLKPLVNGKHVLDVGCASGVMSSVLVTAAKDVDLLDGSAEYIDEARKRLAGHANVRYYAELFETYKPDRHYEVVTCSHVLEHVLDPIDLLERMKAWLAPGGTMIVCVPNALSVHRLLGVEMGFLQKPTDLSERDHQIGHRRVYDAQTLAADIRKAGLRHGDLKGILLKPFPNAQMNALPEAIVKGLLDVGSRMPNYASEIYYECSV